MQSILTLNRTEISTDTAGYVEALAHLEQTECAFLTALQNHYGETQGEQMYQERSHVFEDLQRCIGEMLTQSVVMSLGFLDSNEI